MTTKSNGTEGTDDDKTFVEALMIGLVITVGFIFIGVISFNLMKSEKPELIKTTFRYGQYVQVVDGFYAGQKAKVMEEGITYIDCYRTYKIRFDDSLAGEAVVCNHRLKAIEGIE